MKHFRLLSIGLALAGVLAGIVSCDRSPERKTTIAVVPKVDDASVAAAKTAALAPGIFTTSGYAGTCRAARRPNRRPN